MAATEAGYYTVDAEGTGNASFTFALDNTLLRRILAGNYEGLLIRSDVGDIRIEAGDLKTLLRLLASGEECRIVITSRQTETEDGIAAVWTISLYIGGEPAELPEGMSLRIALPWEKAGNTGSISAVWTGPDGEAVRMEAVYDPESEQVIFENAQPGDYVIADR